MRSQCYDGDVNKKSLSSGFLKKVNNLNILMDIGTEQGNSGSLVYVFDPEESEEHGERKMIVIALHCRHTRTDGFNKALLYNEFIEKHVKLATELCGPTGTEPLPKPEELMLYVDNFDHSFIDADHVCDDCENFNLANGVELEELTQEKGMIGDDEDDEADLDTDEEYDSKGKSDISQGQHNENPEYEIIEDECKVEEFADL